MSGEDRSADLTAEALSFTEAETVRLSVRLRSGRSLTAEALIIKDIGF
jgi:hypothetical protein